MNFDKLVKQTLKEHLKTLHIPANDGQREIYGFSNCDELGFRRFSADDDLWDRWENMYYLMDDQGKMVPMDNFGYEFTNRNVFLKYIQDHINKTYVNYPTCRDKIYEEQAFKDFMRYIEPDMPGVYRFFGNRDHGDYCWGFEIDMLRYTMGHILDAGSEGVSEEDNILDW